MMLAAIAFGLAVGAGVQAFRAWPADGPTTTSSAVVVFIAGLACAYIGGRWAGRGHGGARATATATATATAAAASVGNSVNVLVMTPGAAANQLDGVRVPSPDAVWAGVERRALTLDELDGFDLEEVYDTHEQA